MSETQRAIQRCYAFLEDNLSPLDSLVSKLFEKELINIHNMRHIRATTDPREQVSILLLDCLSGRSLSDLRKFCDILLESEDVQGMFTHGQAARQLLKEIERVKGEGVPNTSGPNPGPRPQSSSGNTGSQRSGSGTGPSWTFPNFPPGFPFQGGFPNIPPGGTSTIIVGNKIENSQINIVGSAPNSSLSVSGGRPHPRGPQFPTGSGGGVNYSSSQRQAASQPPDCHPARQPADDPPLSTQQSSESEPHFNVKLTPEQFIHVLSVIDGNVYEFYRELGVPVADERDGGTNQENVARLLRENPGITWRRVLDALRRVGRDDRARDLEQRLRFGRI